MAITISGQNNNDKILASDGVLDQISGFNVVGVLTASTFETTGEITANHIDVGSSIQLGNAGIITATTLIGNVTGNINSTSNLLLQISGSEKFRVGNGGQLGIGGANYGTSGQVLTSGGSGSAPTWSTINSDKITEGNTEAEVVDTGSDGHFKVTTECSERLRIESTGRLTSTRSTTTAYSATATTNDSSVVILNSGAAGHATLQFQSLSGGSANTGQATISAYNESSGSKNTALTFGTRQNSDSTVRERLRIKSDGKVGVGTDGPSQQFTSYAASGYPVLANGPSNGIGLGGNGVIVFGTKDLGSYGPGAIDASEFQIKTSASERLRIHSNGKITIGTGNRNTETTTGAVLIDRDITAESDSGDPNNYHLVIRSQTNSNTSKIGIGFVNTSDDDKLGASILHHRTGGGSVGDLAFYNSPSDGAMSERLRIKSNGTVNIGTNNQASGDSSSKLRVGTAAGSDVAVCVMGNGGTTTPALYITNWSGSQASNKSIIHFDNSGWGSHQVGSLAGSDGFGIYDDSVLRMSINSAGNTTFHSTGHITLPSGTTAQRVNTTGALRYNSTLGNLEFYDGTSWKRVRLLESPPTNGLLAYWPFSTASRSGSTYNDVSGNGQHFTVNGTITDDTTETKFNGCIDFGTADGNHYLRSSSNSFVNIGSSSGYSGVSISVWVKTSGVQNQWIISEGTVNTRWNYFNEAANAPKWRSTNTGDVIQSGSILTGNWHHLVVTYNSSNNLIQHYRDGSFINSGTTSAPSFNGEYLLVGQHSVLQGNTATYRWRGKMAHMRIYNRVLTSTEVSTLYQQW